MNRFRVQLFARYAELFGAEQVEVTLTGSPCVADLISALRTLPGGASLPPSPFVAVNLTRAEGSTPISGADELALLPPLAGG